jgi:hypothetical protein
MRRGWSTAPIIVHARPLSMRIRFTTSASVIFGVECNSAHALLFDIRTATSTAAAHFS